MRMTINNCDYIFFGPPPPLDQNFYIDEIKFLGMIPKVELVEMLLESRAKRKGETVN